EFFMNDDPMAVIIVIGRHANAMGIPNDAYNTIESYLERAVYGGYIGIVVSDGAPSKIDLIEHEFFIENARNTSVLRNTIQSRTKNVSELIKDSNISAKYPENDLLAALREAKNALSASSVRSITNKHIVIIDTGISTSGDLNLMSMDLSKAKPNIETIINPLKDYEGVGVLPDLAGINITFIGTEDGLAEVAEPQLLNTADKKFIRDLWSQLVIFSGAETVLFESVAGWNKPNHYSEDELSLFPFVSAVTFSNDPIIVIPPRIDYIPSGPDPEPKLPSPPIVDIRLGSEMIGFQAGKAEFLEPENAMHILRPYANALKIYLDTFPAEKIWLIGTTATTNKGGDGDIDLGLRRSEKVKDALENEFGIDGERLNIVGLGAVFPWHVNEFSKGSFDTEIAQENRAVWILNSTEANEKFIMLMSDYKKSLLLPDAINQIRNLLD
ncbi:MAG: hypothetical protein FWC09_04465, partial [Lachnospiraceae bacterium]|nr:hypothetical protein [Lachnospiraceae bacterium]